MCRVTFWISALAIIFALKWNDSHYACVTLENSSLSTLIKIISIINISTLHHCNKCFSTFCNVVHFVAQKEKFPQMTSTLSLRTDLLDERNFTLNLTLMTIIHHFKVITSCRRWLRQRWEKVAGWLAEVLQQPWKTSLQRIWSCRLTTWSYSSANHRRGEFHWIPL